MRALAAPTLASFALLAFSGLSPTAAADCVDGCSFQDCTGNPPGQGIFVQDCAEWTTTGATNTVNNTAWIVTECLPNTAPNQWKDECLIPDN